MKQLWSLGKLAGRAGLCAAALTLNVACGGEDSAASTVEDPRPHTSLAFQLCGGGIDCATLDVPIDRNAPDGPTVGIALARVRADDQYQYRGVVLVNPGGPGASGKRFVMSFARQFRKLFPGFDLIGFDPRGIGESSPLDCEFSQFPYPDSPQSHLAEYLELLRNDSERCARNNGALFEHMGSNEVVADMERIRVALAEPALNFIGMSYGTRLAALYAMAYPDTTRAIVLDAPVAPVVDPTRHSQAAFDALIEAHAQFFADCAASHLACPDDPEQVFDKLIDAAKAEGFLNTLAGYWALNLASPSGRSMLAQLLKTFSQNPTAGIPKNQMGQAPDPLAGLNFASNLTINCADSAVAPPTLAEAEALTAAFYEQSPVFGSRGLPAITCAGWSVPQDPVPAFGLANDMPLLIVGGTQDVLTPFEWAEATNEALPGSRLLRSTHYGHGALAWGSSCVHDVVERYLQDLTLPNLGSTCQGPQ